MNYEYNDMSRNSDGFIPVLIFLIVAVGCLFLFIASTINTQIDTDEPYKIELK
jgi:hypothetical protein